MCELNNEITYEHYCCEGCGCSAFYVERIYTINLYYDVTIPCVCRKVDDGVAAIRSMCSGEIWRESGDIDEDHRFHYDDGEKMDDLESEELRSEVFCPDCLESHEGEPEYVETKRELADQEFYVRCAECNREIEFGWSQPDRGGRIWPSESRCFNPWMAWPEPRYREIWEQKNWLRPVNKNFTKIIKNKDV